MLHYFSPFPPSPTDFDEKCSQEDDWDVDMSVYYEQGERTCVPGMSTKHSRGDCVINEAYIAMQNEYCIHTGSMPMAGYVQCDLKAACIIIIEAEL